jgi:hypothetical protein
MPGFHCFSCDCLLQKVKIIHPALSRLGEEDGEFEAILNDIVRPCPKKTEKEGGGRGGPNKVYKCE